jgi:hypothetical protein
MKKLFIILCLYLTSRNLLAQNNPTTLINGLSLSNQNATYIGPGYVQVPSVATSPVSISGTSQVDIKGGLSVNLKPGFIVNALTGSGFFHGQIQPPLFQVAFIQPNASLPTVGKYQRLEIGVDYSQIASQIATFFVDQTGAYKPGSHSYGTAFSNGTIINPYDPDHISVEALFYEPGSTVSNTIRYGFYYKEFERTTTTDGWEPKTETPGPYYDTEAAYEWRVRFAPDKIGTWNVEIKIYVGTNVIGSSGLFSFNVITSSEKGIVKLASHGQSLYFSETNEPFISVGDNMGWTKEQGWNHDCLSKNCNGGVTSGTINQDDHRIRPDAYLELEKYIDDLKAGGGNSTRLLMIPWGFDIEYEKLCNYSTRNIEMWELDQYINYIEHNGIYLMLSQHQLEFNVASPLYANDPNEWGGAPSINQQWDWHPYRDQMSDNPFNHHTSNGSGLSDCPDKEFKGIDNLVRPQHFFKDQTARKFYKNKLRYIESRWGYSPSIYMYEFMQEIDGVQGNSENVTANSGHSPNIAPPYWAEVDNNVSLNTDVVSWCDAMGDYMKNTLHSHMLTSASYLTFGMWGLPAGVNKGSLFASQNIDVAQGHSYLTREVGDNILQTELEETADPAKWPTPLSSTKPRFVGELDINTFEIDKCTDRGQHNRMWASAFMGCIGPGLLWATPYRRQPPYSGPQLLFNYGTGYEGEFNKNFKAVHTFLSMFDFKNHRFDAYKTNCLIPGCAPAQKKFEIHYMVQDNKEVIMGWYKNRSFNHFTNFICLNGVYEYLSDIIGDSIDGSYWHTEQAPQLIYGQAIDNASNNPAYDCATPSAHYNDDGYVDAFGWGPVPPLTPIQNPPIYFCSNPGNYNFQTYPQAGQTITLPNVIPYDPNNVGLDFLVEWYWTWGNSGGQINSVYTQAAWSDINGNITFSTPPTGGTYPGDWAFKIINTSAQRQIVSQNQLQNKREENHSFSVFPNPTSGSFTIQRSLSEVCTIQIYDPQGRVILQRENVTDKTLDLDLSKQAEGIYLLKVQDNDGKIEIKRIVKQ